MWSRSWKSNDLRRAEGADRDVPAVVRADRDRLVEDVRQPHEYLPDPLLGRLGLGVEVLDPLGDPLHLGQLLGRVDSRALQCGYLRGQLVLPVPQVVDLLLQEPPLPVEGDGLVDQREPVVPSPPAQVVPDDVRGLPEPASRRALCSPPRGGPGDNHDAEDQTSWNSLASESRLSAEEMQLEGGRS